MIYRYHNIRNKDFRKISLKELKHNKKHKINSLKPSKNLIAIKFMLKI